MYIERSNYTANRSFLQQMEGRKRRYQVLEQHNFDARVDYDPIFNQIDKELSDECNRKDY